MDSMATISALQSARYTYKPELPELLCTTAEKISIETGSQTCPEKDADEIHTFYPKTFGKPVLTFCAGHNPSAAKKTRIGVLLSGGQAPGGHNVIAGLFDAMKKAHKKSELIGFHLGPGGLVKGDYEILTAEKIDAYRNTGGFDIIGSGRTKIETPEQVDAAIIHVNELCLDALVIIGGDDSNTNAAFLAECFTQKNIHTRVIGVPKTIDGDLKNKCIEASFGFDTATKVYSELIGNVARDTCSSRKYWNFIRLMGRSASHIALECALQIHPNICLIGEEIAAKNMTLQQLLLEMCRTIAARADRGMNYGIVLIPEGIIEFIPETANLIHELNRNWCEYEKVFTALTTLDSKKKWLRTKISREAFSTLDQLPPDLAEQLLGLRDPHGNILVSQIETEKLFISMITNYLVGMEAAGTYSGKFSPLAQFYGYEGRSVFPSNFDANYCYALGQTAFLLIANGCTGYLASVRNLAKPCREWTAGGVPLTMMMDMEERKGYRKPVIAKSLVALEGAPFKAFAKHRDKWAVETEYVFPGPIQYFGPDEVCNRITTTLELESQQEPENR
jgi:diphosphate-dependent phosphofructokinase